MENQKNVPQTGGPVLRFSEFVDEWERKFLGEITVWASGGTPSKENESYWNGDIPWISASSMRGKEYYNSELKITIEGLKNGSKLAKKGSLLILIRGSMLFNKIPIGIAKKDVAFNQDVKSIVVNESANSEYILFWFEYSEAKIMNMVSGTGIGAGKLDLADLKTLEISFPSLPEQTKIANFLTAIDTKIQQLTQKKALLEEYKKGLMQQLFTQQIRFKDENGEDYPDWEEKKLGDVVEFISTNSFSRSLLNYDEGTVKNIHYGDIHTKFKANFNIDNENVPFINNDVDLSKIADACYCKEGDLIIADASEDYADIGKSIEVINIGGQKLLAGLHTYIARDKNQNTVLGFKGYLMQTHGVRVQMMTAATGISVLGISKGNLSKLEIKLPIKEEQSKIANFLTAIDTKIQTVTMQIEQTQAYKKGLLQQMFI